MKLEWATSACCLPSLPREDLFRAVRQAGYEGVELFCSWGVSKVDPDAPGILRGAGVGVTALHLPHGLEEGRRVIAVAAEHGIPQVIKHGEGKPAEAARWLKPLVEEAGRRGVELVLTNHKGQSIESPADVEAALDACGDAPPWVLLEAGQYWATDQDALAAYRRFRERVRLVHIKDLDAKGHSVPFGTGVSPLREFLAELSAGYGGRVVVELELKDRAPEEVTRLLREGRVWLENLAAAAV